MPLTPVGDTLHRSLTKKGPLKTQIVAGRVLEYATEALNDLFGPELARHAKPLFLKNRTLTITCASSTIAQEIRLNQTKIVEKINAKLGQVEVDRIRYLA